MSISDANEWIAELNRTLTSVMTAGPPATVIVEGYGVAAPTALIVIVAGFENVTCAFALVPHKANMNRKQNSERDTACNFET